MWNGQHPYKRLHLKFTNIIHNRWWNSSKTSFYKLKAFHKISTVLMISVTEHCVTMPRVRNQEVLQKCSYAQATIEWTWWNRNLYCCLSVALLVDSTLGKNILTSLAYLIGNCEWMAFLTRFWVANAGSFKQNTTSISIRKTVSNCRRFYK